MRFLLWKVESTMYISFWYAYFSYMSVRYCFLKVNEWSSMYDRGYTCIFCKDVPRNWKVKDVQRNWKVGNYPIFLSENLSRKIFHQTCRNSTLQTPILWLLCLTDDYSRLTTEVLRYTEPFSSLKPLTII